MAGTAFYMAVGFAGYHSQGFQWRLPAAHQDVNVFGRSDVFAASRRSDGSCQKLLGLPQLREEVCQTNSQSPKALFAGDSHAMALYSSIFDSRFSLNGMLVSAHSCTLYPNLSYTATHERSWGNNCTRISEEVLRVAREIKSIDTVVLVNYFSQVDGKQSGYREHGVSLTDRQAFESGYDYLVKHLLKLGKHVIFVVDVPHLKYSANSCFQDLPLLRRKDCGYSAKENQAIRRAYLREVAGLREKFPGLEIYDPTRLFCKNGRCEYMDGNRSLFNDQDHLSIFGSLLILGDMRQRGLLPGS